MDSVSITLKVYYEEPFWVGVFERIENQQLSVYKITFGLEPQDQDIYQMILKHYQSFAFSPSIDYAVKSCKVNPKKRQRMIHQEVSQIRMSTKSQMALTLQYEQTKKMQKHCNLQVKAELKERHYQQKQQKKKEKHKGH